MEIFEIHKYDRMPAAPVSPAAPAFKAVREPAFSRVREPVLPASIWRPVLARLFARAPMKSGTLQAQNRAPGNLRAAPTRRSDRYGA
jgi:hypothetical protein